MQWIIHEVWVELVLDVAKLSLRGGSSSDLAWGTRVSQPVLDLWCRRCSYEYFGVWLCLSLKTVDWNDCHFLACNAHGTVLLSPRELFRELLSGPWCGELETPTDCHDQTSELCFKDKGKSISQQRGEMMLLLNFTWCFMPLVHYLMKNMMR